MPLSLLVNPTSPSPQHLLGLSDEILGSITNMLSMADRVATSLTCRKLHNLIPALDHEEHRRLTDPSPADFFSSHHVACAQHKDQTPCSTDRATPPARAGAWSTTPTSPPQPSPQVVRWCLLHDGAERRFGIHAIPELFGAEMKDVPAQLKRTHTDAHYIEVDVGYCVHCRTWRTCVHLPAQALFDAEHSGYCSECGRIDAKACVIPDRAVDSAPGRGRTSTSSISHGGYTSEAAERDQNGNRTKFIGIPGVGMLTRGGQKLMPIYEVQS